MSNLYVPTPEGAQKLAELSVCIVTPHASHYSSNDWNTSVMNMIAYSWLHGLKVYQIAHTERMAVHWGRNELAKIVKDNPCFYTGQKYSHLLWLDDDHVFNPDLAVYLAQYADRDMVSALYYGRAGRILPVVYTKDEKRVNDDPYKHYPIVVPPENIFECDAVGFGGLLMRLDVLDRFDYPWFKMFDASGEFGEDIYFCVHAKKGGARIWCDGRYKMGHIHEPEIIREKHYREYLETHKEEMGDNIVVALNTK